MLTLNVSRRVYFVNVGMGTLNSREWKSREKKKYEKRGDNYFGLY